MAGPDRRYLQAVLQHNLDIDLDKELQQEEDDMREREEQQRDIQEERHMQERLNKMKEENDTVGRVKARREARSRDLWDLDISLDEKLEEEADMQVLS